MKQPPVSTLFDPHSSYAAPYRRIPRVCKTLAVLGLLGLSTTQAFALNVLLCNDDSIVAANVRALNQKLVAAGHRVIVSAPVDNQSGSGGALAFLRPIGALTGNERAAKVLGLIAGSPGIGIDPSDNNVFYVNGSPVAACLYGIDVMAPKTWGAAPDLVISGPNEGNNIGAINASSGTFNNLSYAIGRNLPAIAVSDGVTTQVTWSNALPSTHRSFEIADMVLKLVNALVANKAVAGGRLMPIGVGLNVNIPVFAAGTGNALPFRFTRLGRSSQYMPAFYEKLSDSAIAVSAGAGVALPGVSILPGGGTLPTGVELPVDASPTSETNVIATKTAVTVSPVESVPEARRVFEDALRLKLFEVVQ